MRINKSRKLKLVRVVIDILNIILGIGVIGLVGYTFLAVEQRMHLFIPIFYAGAVINFITGIKHFISEKQLQGVGTWIFAVVLLFAGILCGGIIG